MKTDLLEYENNVTQVEKVWSKGIMDVLQAYNIQGGPVGMQLI